MKRWTKEEKFTLAKLVKSGLNDGEIASQLDRSKLSVANKRRKLSLIKSLNYNDHTQNVPSRISKSHLSKKENHHSSKTHRIVSPEGKLYKIKNIALFVRKNPQMFDADDILVRHSANGRSYVRAIASLQHVSSGNMCSWKGWTKC